MRLRLILAMGLVVAACECAVKAQGIPRIEAIQPFSGKPGSELRVTGANFASIPGSNRIHFGSISAQVLSGTRSNLVVSVPTNAPLAPVSVTLPSGLSAVSSARFWAGDAATTSLGSAAPSFKLALSAEPALNRLLLADLDADGWLDVLAISQSTNQVLLFRNAGQDAFPGAFNFQGPIRLEVPKGASSIAAADLNGDGRPDLAVGNRTDRTLSLYENLSSPGTLSRESFGPGVEIRVDPPNEGVISDIAIADIDVDGRPDLVAVSGAPGVASVLQKRGTSGNLGTLAPTSFRAPVHFETGISSGIFRTEAADFNGDGKPDLAFRGSGAQELAILANRSAGASIDEATFDAPLLLTNGIPAAGWAVGDLDANGSIDLATVDLDGEFRTFRRSGPPGALAANQFLRHELTSMATGAVDLSLGDFDADGKLDFIASLGAGKQVLLLRNLTLPGSLESPPFAAPILTPLNHSADLSACGDLDRDGRLDFVAASNETGEISLLRNEGGLSISPDFQRIPFGSDALFRLSANVPGPVGIQWLHNGSPLSGKRSAELLLEEVTHARAGLYAVRVTNLFGTSTSAPVRLEVETTFSAITFHGIPYREGDFYRAVAWTDVDDDGYPDLFLPNRLDELYRNNGDGTFTLDTNLFSPNAHGGTGVWADLDNDGDLDAFVCNWGEDHLWINRGNGQFEFRSGPQFIRRYERGEHGFAVFGDRDNDGFVDVFVSNYSAGIDRLLRNEGGLSFTNLDGVFQSDFLAEAPAWGDPDNDGDLDLFVAGSRPGSAFYQSGAGDADLKYVGPFDPAFGSAWGDFDNDGRLDLAISVSGGCVLFRSTAGGELQRHSVLLPGAVVFGISWGDYDNDGWIDLLANTDPNGPIWLRNQGHGSFQIATNMPSLVPGKFRGCALADSDQDGFLDIFAVQQFGSVNYLLRNNGNPNRWLRAKLKGTVSNGAAIGAKVRLKATVFGTNFWQMREVSGGSGYGSQDSLEVEFGVGDAALIDEILVEWPSGIRQTLNNIAPNQFLHITEPSPGQRFQLQVEVTGSGQVRQDPPAHTFASNAVVRLEPVPEFNHRFVGWQGDAAGKSNPLLIVMTNNLVIEAVFATNNPPSIRILEPSPGLSKSIGDRIDLRASAEDDEGIREVIYYENGNRLGAVSSPPYSFLWTLGTVGDRELVAEAVDLLGRTSASERVVVHVQTAATNVAVFRWTESTVRAGEQAGLITLEIRKDGRSEPAQVGFVAIDGTAFAESDFVATNGILFFSAEELSKNIQVRILDDLRHESDQFFQVVLTPLGQAELAGNSAVSVVIEDDDFPCSLACLDRNLPPIIVPRTLGDLRIDLSPPGVAGGWRLPWLTTWTPSGSSIRGLSAGVFPVEFRPVPGYLEPAPVDVLITEGIVNVHQASYVPAALTRTGALKVNLHPIAVIVAYDPTTRAGWRFVGEERWRESGALYEELPAGTYELEFKPVVGWTSPSSRQVLVRADLQSFVNSTYSPETQASASGIRPQPVEFREISNPDSGIGMGFCGQIITELGSGSGIVVRDRVVLTAAHLLFDESTQSFVDPKLVTWLPRRHFGSFDPKPVTPRGWCILPGYALRRAQDSGLGFLTKAALERDVAAIYFGSSAGAGGFSGFLASTPSTGDWLVRQGALASLAGYPVADARDANQGKLHKSDLRFIQWERESGSPLYRTENLIGLPGMSGAPLLVQHPNAQFYPAAIYLGGSEKAVFRILDEEVAALINCAEVLGDAEPPHLGGSPLRVREISGCTTNRYGFFSVAIEPPEALARGGGFRFKGVVGAQPYSDPTNLFGALGAHSSAAEPRLAATLEFLPAEGFLAPADRSVSLYACESTNIAVRYIAQAGPPSIAAVSDPVRMLSIAGAPGRRYRVETTDQLPPLGSWSLLETFLLETNRLLLTNLPPPIGRRPQFFRALLLPEF